MKKYEIIKNKIVINDIDSFNIEHILECGQIFRYHKDNDSYMVFSGDKVARVTQFISKAEIICSDTDYFIKFFDLDTDYDVIKHELNRYENIQEAIKYGSGIRILKQDKLEMIISFIISSNNNIKRISKTINTMCRNYGRKITIDGFGDYYAFPTIKDLEKIKLEKFNDIGMGYRSKYLYDTIKLLSKTSLLEFDYLQTTKLRKELIKFPGIGPKVADCIMLFAYNKMDVFPIDTWTEKVFYTFFDNNKKETKRKVIAELLREKFANLSGYAQQYLFYYIRKGK